MVPGFQEFLLPVLKFMGDGKEHSRDEISERVPKDYFSFTPEEMKEKTKNGNKIKVFDRVEWSITYLKQSGLLSRPRRSHYIITESGLALLKSDIKEITSKFLYNNYAAFRDFQNRTRNSVGVAQPTTSTVTEDTPSYRELSKALSDYQNFAKIIDNLRSFGAEPSKDQLDKLEELKHTALLDSISSCSLNFDNRDFLSLNDRVNILFTVTRDGYSAKIIPDNIASEIEGIVVDFKGDCSEDTNKRKRRPNWNFYNLGLIDGDVIEYIPDPTQKAIVVSKKGVEYDGETFESLEALTRFISDTDKRQDYISLWSFEGDSLTELYNNTFPKTEN